MKTTVGESGKHGLLSGAEMAQFMLDGYLELDDPIPAELNRQVLDDAQKFPQDLRWNGVDLNIFWNSSRAVREVHELPRVRRIVAGLVGSDAIQNHSWLHITAAGHVRAQHWHVDQDRSSVQLLRNDPRHFDLLTVYFPHDVPRSMGPTLILPSSHLRSVSGRDLSRYKNFLGQKHLSGPAGRVIFCHSLLWHCAQPNHSERARYMFKIRYNPARPQQKLFDTSGWESDNIDQYFRANVRRHAWIGSEADMVAGQVQSWRHYAGGAQ